MNIRHESKILLGFNFASLTDIVFMLLIFFMLSSSFIIQDGFKMKLPKSRVADTHNQKSITITILKDSGTILNGKRIKRNTLGAEIRKIVLASPESVVVIRAYREIALQSMVDVMDIAKAAGVVKFLIATENDF